MSQLRKDGASPGTPNLAARECGQLAGFYRLIQDKKRADETFTECLDEYPAHPYLLAAASDFYIRNEEPERAIEIHRRAVEASPEDVRVWGRLSRVLQAYGNPGEAQAKLEQAVEHLDSP